MYTFCKSLCVTNVGFQYGLYGVPVYILYLYDQMWLVGMCWFGCSSAHKGILATNVCSTSVAPRLIRASSLQTYAVHQLLIWASSLQTYAVHQLLIWVSSLQTYAVHQLLLDRLIWASSLQTLLLGSYGHPR